MAYIEVKNLSKSYGRKNPVKAVDNISFSIPKFGIVGLLGPNGSGKTTTIKSILGLVEFDSGSICILMGLM